MSEILDLQRHYDEMREVIISSTQMVGTDRVHEKSVAGQSAKYPRWPSGIRKLDTEFGGFYGMTVVGGSEGAGKSIMALGSSLCAAELGWGVCYFDAENGERIVQDRFRRWYGETNASEAIKRISGYWHRFAVLPGATFKHLVEQVLAVFTLKHKGLLIVLDSISTIAEMAASNAMNGYQELLKLLFWLDALVRRSNGFISVLALSELNADGTLKYRKAAYTANMAIRMKAEDDQDLISIKITKSRDAKAGNVGFFTRDWTTSSFKEPLGPVAAAQSAPRRRQQALAAT